MIVVGVAIWETTGWTPEVGVEEEPATSSSKWTTWIRIIGEEGGRTAPGVTKGAPVPEAPPGNKMPLPLLRSYGCLGLVSHCRAICFRILTLS